MMMMISFTNKNFCSLIVLGDGTQKVKSEKETAPQYTYVLSYTSDLQITLSKPLLHIIGLMETIADFAVKLYHLGVRTLQT